MLINRLQYYSFGRNFSSLLRSVLSYIYIQLTVSPSLLDIKKITEGDRMGDGHLSSTEQRRYLPWFTCPWEQGSSLVNVSTELCGD